MMEITSTMLRDQSDKLEKTLFKNRKLVKNFIENLKFLSDIKQKYIHCGTSVFKHLQYVQLNNCSDLAVKCDMSPSTVSSCWQLNTPHRGNKEPLAVATRVQQATTQYHLS